MFNIVIQNFYILHFICGYYKILPIFPMLSKHAGLCLVTVFDSVIPSTVSHQAPVSMEFSKQEYWSGLPRPPPGDLPNSGIKPRFPALQADSLPAEPLGKPVQYILIVCFIHSSLHLLTPIPILSCPHVYKMLPSQDKTNKKDCSAVYFT